MTKKFSPACREFPYARVQEHLEKVIEYRRLNDSQRASGAMFIIVNIMKKWNGFDKLSSCVTSCNSLKIAAEQVISYFRWAVDGAGYSKIIAQAILQEAIVAAVENGKETAKLRKVEMDWHNWDGNEDPDYPDVLVEELNKRGDPIKRKIFRNADPIDGDPREWIAAQDYYKSLKRARMSEWIGWSTIKSKGTEDCEE